MPSGLLHDRRALAGILAEIAERAGDLDHRASFMEVCGTHTHAIAAAGLRHLLTDRVRLVSGPGCPVCVTPVGYLDRALSLAALPDVTLCTFGDLMRVPSSTVSLETARAEGAEVEIVYSPRDALEIARTRPEQRIIFLSVGFETTTPTVAAALVEAENEGIENFFVLPGNKVVPPVLAALAADPDLGLDGLLLPGHVSVITGASAFDFLAERHRLPAVVVGFAPADVARGILELLRQKAGDTAQTVNLYRRAVTREGNTTARALVDRCFASCSTSWRGLGEIPGSGLSLRDGWSERDAAAIQVQIPEPREPADCRCGEILRGALDPPDCPLFGSACTPSDPVGACMVSSEGSCAAWYQHERRRP